MSSISSVTSTVTTQPVPRQTVELDKAQANKTAETKPASAPQPSKPTETMGNNLNVVA